jgi:hypothetical protein
MRNPRFRDSVGELAAPIRGVPKDELIGEDISQHRRTLRLARGAVTLLALLLALAVVGGVVALVQRNNARNQTELALAGQVSATGVANLADRLDVAQLLAAEGHSRRETPQTTAALFRAATESPYLTKFVDNRTRVTALMPAVNTEGVYVTSTSETVPARIRAVLKLKARPRSNWSGGGARITLAVTIAAYPPAATPARASGSATSLRVATLVAPSTIASRMIVATVETTAAPRRRTRGRMPPSADVAPPGI